MMRTERFREYDYGPVIGVGAAAVISSRGRPFFAVSYRYAYINVRNGSIWNPDDSIEIELPGRAPHASTPRWAC